ncbi:MAG: hypothetical protein WC661_11410 [Opitutaceae bacterium]|jgi:hypothetical protein
MAAKSQDKIVFGIALLVLLSAGAWTFLQQPKLAALRNAASSTGGAQAAYVPTGVDASKVSTSTWPAPAPQPRGELWVYDVFTPPEIYYDATTKEFTVTPPDDTPPPPPPPPPPFGLELVDVKQDVFRLQLVGYVGTPGAYIGTFENTLTGDTFLGKAGKKVPALGLTIRDFDVKRNQIPAPGSMPIYETVATAVVIEDKTGEEVALTNKARRIKGTPIAIFKATGGDKLFEQKSDTTLVVGDVTYSVGAVTSDPASAVVTKQAPGMKSPETKTLVVAPPAAPAPAAAPAPETAKPDAVSTAFPPAEAPVGN